jgi:hypothetical protein
VIILREILELIQYLEILYLHKLQLLVVEEEEIVKEFLVVMVYQVDQVEVVVVEDVHRLLELVEQVHQDKEIQEVQV